MTTNPPVASVDDSTRVHDTGWLREVLTGGVRELRSATERRVPFLDGLRAFAVLLVVNQHVSGAFAKVNGANRYTNLWPVRNGWMGVDLFFVLSGYFIGSQLWRELQKTCTISYKNFFIRRGLRIWPLYFFIFALVFMSNPAAAAAKQYGWTDLVFLTNYTNHGIVGGSWSLCSEEQFYLLTPLALLLIGRRSMSAYRWGLGAVLALVVVVRIITYVAITGHFFGKHPDAFTYLYYPFHTHCDGLIAGLIVANLAASRDRIGGLASRPGLLVGLSVVLMGVLSAIQGDVFPFLGLALIFAALVWWGVSVKSSLFSSHIFYLLSRLSFGMYLNHEYMQHWVVTTVEPFLGLARINPALASFAGFLILALLSAALSVLSFCLVEHPFLVLRQTLLKSSAPHLTAQ